MVAHTNNPSSGNNPRSEKIPGAHCIDHLIYLMSSKAKRDSVSENENNRKK